MGWDDVDQTGRGGVGRKGAEGKDGGMVRRKEGTEWGLGRGVNFALF